MLRLQGVKLKSSEVTETMIPPSEPEVQEMETETINSEIIQESVSNTATVSDMDVEETQVSEVIEEKVEKEVKKVESVPILFNPSSQIVK